MLFVGALLLTSRSRATDLDTAPLSTCRSVLSADVLSYDLVVDPAVGKGSAAKKRPIVFAGKVSPLNELVKQQSIAVSSVPLEIFGGYSNRWFIVNLARCYIAPLPSRTTGIV